MSWWDIDFGTDVYNDIENYAFSYIYSDADVKDNTAKAVADASAFGDNTFTFAATETSTTGHSSTSSALSESATD